ncbi:MAG: adenosylcobinamide-GDP ribazoletransferase [bacterium]
MQNIKKNIKKELIIFFTALTYFTRIPCYKFGNYSAEYLSKSSGYFPLIGWIVGGFGAVIYILSIKIFSHSIAILFSMIGTIIITGAFHEDGLADVCDAFGGGWTKEQILNIMKDSRVGTYGILGIVLLLALKYLCLLEINSKILPFTIIAGHSLSRFAAVISMRRLNYVRENDETSKSKLVSKKLNFHKLIIAVLFGLLPIFLLGYQYCFVIIPVFLITEILNRYFRGKIGGYTGDCLGAVQQITEITFYIFVLVLWKYI